MSTYAAILVLSPTVFFSLPAYTSSSPNGCPQHSGCSPYPVPEQLSPMTCLIPPRAIAPTCL